MALLLAIVAAADAAAETVRFPVATTPPTPLQERLARERGQPLAAASPAVELTGELYRPAGTGPFPAVVSLHGCAGPPSRAVADAAGAAYVALGYALLVVDSFGPRGVTQRCATESGVPADRIMDAYGALIYLAGLPFIDPDRIAVAGYSQGADTALGAVKLGGIETQFDRKFRAAIAYFPYCVASYGAVSVPAVILIGDLDEATPARACRDMMAGRSGEGAPLRLVVYPGAHHAFTSARLRDKPETTYGYRSEYNEAAAHAAWEEERAVLREVFGR
ncbi:MAG: hydrolase [Reyranella sp.]|nr:MAG: hydrolase [Reyranella sp.]